MKNRARILCFNLLTLLFVLLTALPAFAQDISVNITVNEGGTASGVGVGECGNNYTCGDGGTFCSFSFPSSCGPAELDWFAQNGYDSNGNYDAVFNSWSGCPDVSNSCGAGYNITTPCCYVAQNANVTATFSKVYGSPSNVSVQLQGSGTGSVETPFAFGPQWYAISCGNGYTACSGNVNSGTNNYIELDATPSSNSYFAGWSGCPQVVTGNCAFGLLPCCQIPAGQNASVTATFSVYTVTPSAGANGSISPNAPQIVSPDGTTSFTVTPNSGYYIASVTGCGGSLSGNTYTTGPITGNCSVSATFGADLVVTSSAGADGSVSPNTAQLVALNGTSSFTVTPNSGYYIASVTGCGGSLSGNSYTTGPITSNCTVSATFAPDFLVISSAGANGSISPTDQFVVPNGTASFTVTPNYGYGASATGCGGSLSGNTYTTGQITSDCTVSATFSALPTYTVTSSAGTNGSVSPTSATVYSGYSFTLTITPASGYMLNSLTDNGKNVISSAGWDGSAYLYTIPYVSSNNSIQASFKVGAPPASQGPALSILAGIFLAAAALGVILWVRRKVNE